MKNKNYEYSLTTVCTITKYIGNDTVVEIPDKIDGKIVDKLGVKSFAKKVVFVDSDEVIFSQPSPDKLVDTKGVITEVTIPRSVVSIEESAFSEQALTKVTFNEGLEYIGVTAFSGCKELESIVIPSTVKFIDNYAFAGCTNLKNVSILNKDIKLGKEIFLSISSLIDVDFCIWSYLSLSKLLKAFYYKFENINTLTTEEQKQISSFVKRKPTLIKELFLSNNSKLIHFLIDNKINVNLEDLIEYIDHHIELNHTEITAVLLDYKNKKYAKEEIDNFTENKELIEIGLELPTLKQLKQKWNVGKVDGGLKISGYKGNNTTETIPTGTVDGDLILELGFSPTYNFAPIENLIVDAKINTISENTFQYEYTLTTIKFPSSLKHIRYNAFYDCENLTTIEFNSQVEIDSNAFNCCPELKIIQN